MMVSVWALYAGTRADAESPAVYYSVSPGDTLWSIAADHYPPSEDLRPKVEAIKSVNGLEDSRIKPGMGLELPPG